MAEDRRTLDEVEIPEDGVLNAAHKPYLGPLRPNLTERQLCDVLERAGCVKAPISKNVLDSAVKRLEDAIDFEVLNNILEGKP